MIYRQLTIPSNNNINVNFNDFKHFILNCYINVLKANVLQNHFKHYLKQIYLTHNWDPNKY